MSLHLCPKRPKRSAVLLVLDEPANHLDMDSRADHLDMDSRAELIKSLNAYTGAVLIISHDRNLLESVVDRLWVVKDGTISTYDGSLEDYRREQLEADRSTKRVKNKPLPEAKQSRKDAADARKRVAPLKRAVEALEKKISSHKAKIVEIDNALSVTDLFTTNPERAVSLGKSRVYNEKLVETLEDEWLTSLEAYERAKEKEGL